MTELKKLLKAALMPSKYTDLNFSKEDLQQAATNKLIEHFGADNISVRDLRDITKMRIIEEAIDELLPEAITDIFGDWAEVKSFGRDEEVKFTLRNVGKTRALLSLVPGARGGVYKARRLDDKNLFMETRVYTAGLFVTLEELILNKVTLVELMDNILLGITFEIAKDLVAALRMAKTLAPAANHYSGADIETDKLDKAIRIVSQYGRPVGVTFYSLAAKISNVSGSSNPNRSTADLDDIRNQGYVAIYKGTPIIRVPNFLKNELNAEWVFSEADIFILPTEGKLAKIGMKGESYMEEFKHPSGSVEQNFHKIMGVNILAYENIAIYTDTNILAAESGSDLV